MSIIKFILFLHTASCVVSFVVAPNNFESKMRLKVKNPESNYKYIKRRIQKGIRGFKKALPEITKKSQAELEAVTKIAKVSQYSLYGYKMSRMPGDGGAINRFVRGANNRAVIAAYYTGTYNPDIQNMSYYRNRDGPVKYDKENLTCKPYDIYSITSKKSITMEQIEVINAYPDVTFGVHQGKEASKAETFGQDFTPPASSDEYRFYALGKMPKQSKIPKAKARISPVVQNEQGYRGLITDVLFGHIDDPDVDMLRRLEIFLKHRNIEKKPPPKKTYWSSTYTWDVPDEVTALVDAVKPPAEEEDPFMPKLPESTMDYSFGDLDDT